jgi:hypothetical protein
MKKPPGQGRLSIFRGNITMRYHQKAKPRFAGNAPYLRELARALGGDVRGQNWIEAPAPGAPHTDRSLQIALSPNAPDGFTIVSRSASRHNARCHVAAAIDRIRNGKLSSPDLFGGQ